MTSNKQAKVANSLAKKASSKQPRRKISHPTNQAMDKARIRATSRTMLKTSPAKIQTPKTVRQANRPMASSLEISKAKANARETKVGKAGKEKAKAKVKATVRTRISS